MGRWRKGTWQMVLRNMSKEDMWGLLFEMAEKNQALQEKIKTDFSTGKYTDTNLVHYDRFIETPFRDYYSVDFLRYDEGQRLEKWISSFRSQNVPFILKKSGTMEAFFIFRTMVSKLYFLSFESVEQETSIWDKMIDFCEGILQKAGPEEKEVMHRWFLSQ